MDFTLKLSSSLTTPFNKQQLRKKIKSLIIDDVSRKSHEKEYTNATYILTVNFKQMI